MAVNSCGLPDGPDLHSEPAGEWSDGWQSPRPDAVRKRLRRVVVWSAIQIAALVIAMGSFVPAIITWPLLLDGTNVWPGVFFLASLELTIRAGRVLNGDLRRANVTDDMVEAHDAAKRTGVMIGCIGLAIFLLLTGFVVAVLVNSV